MSDTRTTTAMFRQCACGYTNRADHPIPHCFQCERPAYEKAFAEMRERADYGIFLGHDPYAEALYFWRDGKVIGVEGRFYAIFRNRTHDQLVADLTKVETENRDLLAENARLRRRLEGK